METIPTPRTTALFDAFERRACGLIHMQFKVAEMERELYIAKQALEAIQNFSEDNLAKNTSRNALNPLSA